MILLENPKNSSTRHERKIEAQPPEFFNGPSVGVVDLTVALFSEMGQRNFKRRPAARLTLVGDRAVMR